LAPREVPLHPSFIPEAKAGGRIFYCLTGGVTKARSTTKFRRKITE
jgi:hypothetical protein